MPLRWGPGPVFVYESIAAARRWQHYALRSLAVLALLAGLFLVWVSVGEDARRKIDAGSIHELAEIGGAFYAAIAFVQVTLVLMAAPAATAGAVCLDRARGSLTHVLVTDLSDAEIVLGKLFARLAPVLALVAASVPVLAIASVLGGVPLELILLLTAVSLALAGFGCALALAVSVRATKTHEVLMAVYAVWGAVILGPLIWALAADITGAFQFPPEWLYALDPYYLVVFGGEPSATELASVLGGVLAMTAGLVVYAVWRLRREVSGGRRKAARSRRAAWWTGPTLDGNPVLWREWQHTRPSRTARVVWGIFTATALLGTGWGLVFAFSGNVNTGAQMIIMVNCLEVGLGLLLVSLSAPTALAEERARGSLDVLLTTPLSTASIVAGKWRAAYRVVPRLAILPAIGLTVLALIAPDFTPPGRGLPNAPSLTNSGRVALVVVPVAWVLVQGAAVTSLGLLLATWVPRVGRAVALSVSAYVAVSFGGVILLEFGVAELIAGWFGYRQPSDRVAVELFMIALGSPNPFFSQMIPEFLFSGGHIPPKGAFWWIEVGGLVVTLAVTAGLYGLTLLTFERRLGRVSERPRRAPAPPSPAAPQSSRYASSSSPFR